MSRNLIFKWKNILWKDFSITMTHLQGDFFSESLKFHNFLRFQFQKLRLLEINRLNNFTLIWSLESFPNGHMDEKISLTQFEFLRRAETQNEPIQFEVCFAVWKTSTNLRTLISSLDIWEFYFEIKKYSLKIFFDDNDGLARRKEIWKFEIS